MDAQNLFHTMKKRSLVLSVCFSCLEDRNFSDLDYLGLRSLCFFAKSLILTLAIGLLASNSQAWGVTYRTENFIVQADDSSFAQQVGVAAEGFRAELAVLWLGETLPKWSNPCVIKVKTGADLIAGGETVFSFSKGEVYDWKMRVQGSKERILDSVLPHEVTHTIIASYLRVPVPRWLDEGMATAVEADVERSHYRTMLATFLHTNRGIPFNEMVFTKEYPKDLTPFYSQAFSICEYLIMIGGHRRLARFAKIGNETNDWNGALKQFYECDSLGALQIEWLEWVRAWDVANQPNVLPETRKLPEFDNAGTKETALAQNDASFANVWGNGIEFWGRSESDSSDVELITRGQIEDQDPKQKRFLQGLTQPFASRPSKAVENIDGGDWRNSPLRRSGSVVRQATPATQASPNGTVWRSGENLLANGAGSARKIETSAPVKVSSNIGLSGSASYSNPSGLFRR